jgi:adenosylcobinamide-phosphate synthase
MSMEILTVFLLALALDLLAGEPPARIHPVVWIGTMISFLRKVVPATRAGGLLVVIVVVAVSVLSGHLLVRAASLFPYLGALMAAYLLKSTFSIRCLILTSSEIGQAIDRELDRAKMMLPALVGREPSGLTKAQTVSAVIESLSENYVDTILSPILYFLLFQPWGLGLEAALAFKAISTMDSMLGYKTKGLKDLGFIPAKLDDLANYLPARLSILLMALASPRRAEEILRAAWLYNKATPSPNSGWPMSATAGALGIHLEKPGFYVLMEEGREPETSDIRRAIAFIGIATTLTLAASSLILVL